MTKKATLWVARWRNNSLHIYTEKPTRDDGYGEFWLFDGNINENSMPLDCELFPEVTYEKPEYVNALSFFKEIQTQGRIEELAQAINKWEKFHAYL